MSQAFCQFLDNVTRATDLSALPVGQHRLDRIQAGDARTASGMHYVVFLGHRDVPLPPEPLPEDLFEAGEYDEDEEEE